MKYVIGTAAAVIFSSALMVGSASAQFYNGYGPVIYNQPPVVVMPPRVIHRVVPVYQPPVYVQQQDIYVDQPVYVAPPVYTGY